MKCFPVLFFAVGKKITFSAQFRFRGIASFDVDVVDFDSEQSSDLEQLPELVAQWSEALGGALKRALDDGYYIHTWHRGGAPALVRDLENVIWLRSVGYGERESAVNEFLKIVLNFSRTSL